jgi:AAA15 family ATPase/GTPase
MKIQLKSLHIVGCGAIEELLLDFTDDKGNVLPISVIAGANGSGKTTVFTLITQLSELFCPNRTHLIMKKIESAQINWLIDDKEFVLFYGKHINEKLDADNSVQFINGEVEKRNKRYEEIHRLIHDQEGKDITCFDFPTNEKESVVNKLPSILFFPHHSRYFDNTVDNRGTEISNETTKLKFVNVYQPPTQFKGSLSSYLIWLDYAEREHFEKIINFLNALNFEGKTFSINRKNLEVLVNTKNGHEHKLSELSSGEQNILIILSELRRKLIVPNSIVLIDEIENSLHYAFQIRLLKGLEELQKIMPFQLILSTHSRDVIDYIGLEKTKVITEI